MLGLAWQCKHIISINSIEELNAKSDKFNSQFVSIEKGASITAKTGVTVEEFALEHKYMNSPSIAIKRELKKSMDRQM